MDYFEKIEKNPYKDLYWNVPEEQKRGELAVVGGNAGNFRVPVKTAEYLLKEFPLKTVRVVLPEALKTKLPPIPDAVFLKDVAGGSIADTDGLLKALSSVDFSMIVGDLSKNSVTAETVEKAVKEVKKPVLVTRDAVDLIAGEKLDQILMREGLILVGSLVQMQKILKTIYYPKMLLASQSLMQVVEVFHKFTLSYPVQIVTMHEGQIIVSAAGKVVAVPLVKTPYSVLTIWNGEMAARISCLNLYNPGKFIEATVAAVIGK